MSTADEAAERYLGRDLSSAVVLYHQAVAARLREQTIRLVSD